MEKGDSKEENGGVRLWPYFKSFGLAIWKGKKGSSILISAKRKRRPVKERNGGAARKDNRWGGEKESEVSMTVAS